MLIHPYIGFDVDKLAEANPQVVIRRSDDGNSYKIRTRGPPRVKRPGVGRPVRVYVCDCGCGATISGFSEARSAGWINKVGHVICPACWKKANHA